MNLVAYLLGTALGLSFSFIFLPIIVPQETNLPKPLGQEQDARHSKLETREIITVAIAMHGGPESQEWVQVINETWGHKYHLQYYIKNNSKTPLMENMQGVEILMDHPLPLRVQILDHLCSTHTVNYSQWFILVSKTSYIQVSLVSHLLIPFDPEGFAYLSEGHSGNTAGICSDGEIEILSHGLILAICPLFDGCDDEDCIETKIKGVCSITPPIQVFKDPFCQLPRAISEGTSLSPKTMKTLFSCPFISSVTTLSFLHLTHNLIMSDNLAGIWNTLEDLYQELDLMNHLLTDSVSIPIIPTNEEMEEEMGKVTFWELLDHHTHMSLTEAEPVKPANSMWVKEFDWSVEKVMKLINKLSFNKDDDSNVINVLKKVHSIYWRQESTSNLVYILNIEVQPTLKQVEYGRSKLLQAQFKRVFLKDSETLLSLKKPLTIVVALSELYTKELQRFLHMIGNLTKGEHTTPLSLIIVLMGQSTTSATDKILKAFSQQYSSIPFHKLTSPQWLCRGHALSLALQHTRPTDILFLADIELEFDAVFLERCSAYPRQGSLLYLPLPLTRYSHTLHSFMTKLTGATLSGHWITQTRGLACVYASDILSAVMMEGKGIPREIHIDTVLGTLAKKGLTVMQGPDNHLNRSYNKGQCGRALIGEPCPAKGENRDEKYAMSQLSAYLLQQPMRV